MMRYYLEPTCGWFGFSATKRFDNCCVSNATRRGLFWAVENYVHRVRITRIYERRSHITRHSTCRRNNGQLQWKRGSEAASD